MFHRLSMDVLPPPLRPSASVGSFTQNCQNDSTIYVKLYQGNKHIISVFQNIVEVALYVIEFVCAYCIIWLLLLSKFSSPCEWLLNWMTVWMTACPSLFHLQWQRRNREGKGKLNMLGVWATEQVSLTFWGAFLFPVQFFPYMLACFPSPSSMPFQYMHVTNPLH